MAESNNSIIFVGVDVPSMVENNSSNSTGCEEYIGDNVFSGFVLCLALIGLVANVALIKEHVTKKDLKINFFFLIVTLGVYDSLFLFFLIVGDSARLMSDVNSTFYILMIYFSEWAFYSSMLTIILISIDRYYSISLK